MLIREQRPTKRDANEARRRRSRQQSRLAARLRVESLEVRSLLSGSGTSGDPSGPVAIQPNSTLDQAQLLGDLTNNPLVAASGTVQNNRVTGAGSVDWYSFTLDGPAQVTLDLHPAGSAQPLNGVLSLYNSDQLFSPDVYNPYGYRQIAQASSSNGADPVISRELSPGTYYAAVSGAGNLYFDPLLAGSGLAGATGGFQLSINTATLNLDPSAGPIVLTSDPAPGAVLSASPFVIRLDTGSALDPSTVIAGQTVTLTYNPNGTFGDGQDQNVPLAWTNVGVGGTELQLAPLTPLAPGYYKVFLAGDSTTQSPVVADLQGNPLGADSANPLGSDYTETFQINGINGQTGPGAGSTNTAATAQDLGNISSTSLVQVAGAIGNDPSYNDSDPAHDPANQVNFYHFQVSGPGRYAVVAEVFAGRIGSPLDPGVSLYRLNPSDGTLQFLAGNNNTDNNTVSSDGLQHLQLDSMLTQGLTAGDYYLAVADGPNVPSPTEQQALGSSGLLDPSTPYSAQNGTSTGPYVLNLLVQSIPTPPQVIGSYPAPGAVLTQPPTRVTVQFTEPINVQKQAYINYLANADPSTSFVYIQGADGTRYYPRLDSINPTTNQATFLMLDRLAPGDYVLHLSGPGGLVDLAGNALPGNDPSGDYVIPFTVTGTNLVQPALTGHGVTIQLTPGSGSLQNLGVLFPHELQAGLTLNNAAPQPPHRAAAAFYAAILPTYTFTLLEDTTYIITLSGASLPPSAQITLTAGTGRFVILSSRDGNRTWFGEFAAGSYKITVQGLTPGTAYQLGFRITQDGSNPTALVSGPAPGLQLRFDTIAAPSVTGGSSPGPGGGTNNPGPTTPGGGTNNTPGETPGSTGSPQGGTGGTSSPIGPISGPIASTGTSTPTTSGSVIGSSGTSGSSSGTPVVTLSVPTGPFSDSSGATTGGGPAATLVGGAARDGAGEALAVAFSGSASNAASQAANLVSGSLALLGVGPVGGVQSATSTASTVQVVQISLPSQGNSPIPMGLVSLVTLTTTGELGDLPPASDVSLEDAGAGALAEPIALLAEPAGRVLGPLREAGDALEQVAAWWAGAPLLPLLDGSAAGATDSAAAATPGVIAAPLANSAVPVPGSASPAAAAGGEAGAAQVESLATAYGPWLFLSGVLGTITCYARQRRLARGRAAAEQFADAPSPPRGLSRLWRRSRNHTLPHAMRKVGSAGVAMPRLRACSGPKHQSNP